MTTMRFSNLLLISVLATAADAMKISSSLKNAASEATMRNPQLRQKDADRKARMHNQIRSMAVTPDAHALRKLQEEGQEGEQAAAEGDQNNVNYAYNWDESANQQAIGFDITDYAVKYTKCATVQSYSDYLAEDEYIDTVLAAKRFAVFRLCPTDQCSDSSSNGCGSNYGEYMVSLDQFLLAMMDYQESRVAGYCEYCQNCAAIESAKHFWKEVYQTRDNALTEAKESYQSWYTAYLEDYANGGYQNYKDENGNIIDASAAQHLYYEKVRNSNNYANAYAKNNYGNYNSNGGGNYGNSGSYGNNAGNQIYGSWATNQDMWRVNGNQYRQSSNQNAWANMGNQGGTFFGSQILNGYVDEDGVFQPVYGYINYMGEYVSLEEDTIDWDEGLWGVEPDGWDGVDVDTESCLYQYAGSCYNQYDACMQILEDEDYQEYLAYQQSGGNVQNQYGYEQARDSMSRRATLKDFLGCVEIDPSEYISTSSNQYASKYGYNQYSQQSYSYAQKNQYNCYGDDEACEKARQYNEAIYQYNQQQQQNRRYFVGPHCASDGHKIHLAVYKDEYCSVIDESTQVADILGYTPSDHIDLFPNECMACMHDQGEEVWYEDEEVYYLEPMCSMLYQYSGKCNRNLSAKTYTYGSNVYSNNANNGNNAAAGEMDADGNAWNGGNQYNRYGNGDWQQMYQSSQQKRNEEAVCSFIDSVTSGTYGENGEIDVSNNVWSLQSWSSAGSISEQSRNMSPGMKAGLAITAIATLIMAIIACVLQGLIARKSNANSWTPARRSKDMDPTDLARQNSGITMGRSQSGTGAAPLI